MVFFFLLWDAEGGWELEEAVSTAGERWHLSGGKIPLIVPGLPAAERRPRGRSATY